MNREFERIDVRECDMLTPKELAYILRVNYCTVSRWRSRGMVFTAGLIRLSESRAWLAEQEEKRKERNKEQRAARQRKLRV